MMYANRVDYSVCLRSLYFGTFFIYRLNYCLHPSPYIPVFVLFVEYFRILYFKNFHFIWKYVNHTQLWISK